MNDLEKWARDLFPINRSLTGSGVRQTLEYISRIVPELVIKSYPSGKNVFDWEIPQEWEIDDAWIEHIDTGEKFAHFAKNNLRSRISPLDTFTVPLE